MFDTVVLYCSILSSNAFTGQLPVELSKLINLNDM